MSGTRGKRVLSLCALVLFGCAVMTVVDGVLRPPYFAKSAVKLFLFLLLPLLHGRAQGIRLRGLFRLRRHELPGVLAPGLGVFVVILGAYALLHGTFDFSGITALLEANAGVGAENFLRISLYIALVNSLLEEFFFRGFAFLALREDTGALFAHIFSALSFALYHTAMMLGWFPLPLFLLALAGLFVGGLLFNALDAKSKSIFPSWCVHICANLAINAVGFHLFGML